MLSTLPRDVPDRLGKTVLVVDGGFIADFDFWREVLRVSERGGGLG